MEVECRGAVDIDRHPKRDAEGTTKDRALATQTSSSNTRLIAIGAVVLLVGVILVLLLLRGTVGGDDPVESDAAGDQTDQTDAADGSAGGGSTTDGQRPDLVTGEETSTARVDLPLDLEEGQEAVTVRASYARGAAALPAAGDRVVVYRLGAADQDEDDEDAVTAPDGDAERVLDDVEVLGVIGPRPAANDGTLTFVLAIDEADVAGLLPIARDAELWLTLLPGTDDSDVDGADTDEGEDE